MSLSSILGAAVRGLHFPKEYPLCFFSTKSYFKLYETGPGGGATSAPSYSSLLLVVSFFLTDFYISFTGLTYFLAIFS